MNNIELNETNVQRLIALILFIFLLPLFGLLGVIVKFTSPGPFIFKQKRMGKNFQVFTIYKIRTMVEDAEELKQKYLNLNEADGPFFKIKYDPRFTAIGRILSWVGIDEIPQLINVMKGEMDFVGPRPLPVNEALKVSKAFIARFSVTPGITSLWVIRGTHDLTFEQWMQSDLEYIKKKRIFLDVYIAILTVFLIIFKWNRNTLLTILISLIIPFYALYPDQLWWVLFVTFFTFVIYLDVDFGQKPSGLLLLVAFFLLLSTLHSINRINSVPVFFAYLIIFLFSRLIKEESKTYILKGICIGTLLIGAMSTIFSLFKILQNPLPQFLSFLNNEYNIVIPFFGHAFYAIFLIIIIPYVLEKNQEGEAKLFWKTIFFLCNVFLLFSFSKVAIFIGYAQIFIFILVKKYNRKKLINHGNIMLGSIFLFVVYLFIVFAQIQKNPWLNSKIFKSSLPTRLEYWTQDWKTLSNISFDRLLYGYGMDTFYELSNKYQSKPLFWVRSSHNFFIQFLIENGLPAFIILIAFLLTTFIRNFSQYVLYEKMIIFSLMVYSLGSTVDLNAYPALLIFFILINKKPGSSSPLMINLNKVSLYILFLVIVYFWLNYISTYLSIYVNKKTADPAIVKIFPYESSFWLKIIEDNRNNKDALSRIKQQLSGYSTTNIDLEQKLVEAVAANDDSCLTLKEAGQFLIKSPLNTETQKKYLESYNLCPIKDYESVEKILDTVEPYFILPVNVKSLRPFMQFAASYNYWKGQRLKFNSWFEKTWNIEVENNTKLWESQIFSDINSSLPIRGPFKIRLNMVGGHELSGIGIISKFGSDKIRLQDTKLFIGLKDNGSTLHLDVNDGLSVKPIIIFESSLKNSGDIIIELDVKGFEIKISDSERIQIAEIDINNATGNRFPKGFFVDNEIYLSYGVSPGSYLKINKFIIY